MEATNGVTHGGHKASNTQRVFALLADGVPRTFEEVAKETGLTAKQASPLLSELFHRRVIDRDDTERPFKYTNKERLARGKRSAKATPNRRRDAGASAASTRSAPARLGVDPALSPPRIRQAIETLEAVLAFSELFRGE